MPDIPVAGGLEIGLLVLAGDVVEGIEKIEQGDGRACPVRR